MKRFPKKTKSSNGDSNFGYSLDETLKHPHLLVWMEDVPLDVFDVFQVDLKGLH